MILSPSPETLPEVSGFWDIVLYSTIPIVDSNLNTGPLVNLSPPMNTSVSYIQLFRCSLSLVNQTATVDTQSQQLQALGPDIKKTVSTWAPYKSPLTNVTTNGNSFMDAVCYSFQFRCFSDCTSGQNGTNLCPHLTFRLYMALRFLPLWQTCECTTAIISHFQAVPRYIIQTLNLPAANHNSTQNVTLHELENALSNIVAAMFWTCKHRKPLKC
jgi:hypothetical protein